MLTIVGALTDYLEADMLYTVCICYCRTGLEFRMLLRYKFLSISIK